MASGVSDKAGAAAAPFFSLSSRADSCRASSSKALFSTGVSTGDFTSPTGRNGSTFFGVSSNPGLGNSLGVSTGVSKSVGCEVSKAIGADESAMLDDATLDATDSVSAGRSSTNRSSASESAEKSSPAKSSAENSSTEESSI